MKRVMSVFLATVIMFSCVIFVGAQASSENSSTDKKVVEFGSYPQTRVTDESLINELEAQQPFNSGDFEEYYGKPTTGGGSNDRFYENPHMMHFRDVVYENEKYRGITITFYRPSFTYDYCPDHNCQSDNGYIRGSDVYWFKYEPLEWMVFDEDNSLALCEKIIDSQPFNNEYSEDGSDYTVYKDGQIKYANNLYTSYIFDWLNDDFFNIAFTEEEQALLEKFDTNTEPVSGNDGDMRSAGVGSFVSLLTHRQAVKSPDADPFAAELKDELQYSETSDLATDYALAQGLRKYMGLTWWLATPDSSSTNMNYIAQPSTYTRGGGEFPACTTSHMVAVTTTGVRPVICLENILAEDVSDDADGKSFSWFSKDSEEEDSGNIAEGECNSKIDWELSEDGVLYISGKGDMPEWDDSEGAMAPWYYENHSDIKSVVIEGKIKTIGKLAFYGCENLESVTIPESVKAIGECAFNDCEKLTSIYYGSDEEDWNKIEIDSDNIDFNEKEIYFSEKSASGLKVIGIVLVAGYTGGGVVMCTLSIVEIMKKRKRK